MFVSPCSCWQTGVFVRQTDRQTQRQSDTTRRRVDLLVTCVSFYLKMCMCFDMVYYWVVSYLAEAKRSELLPSDSFIYLASKHALTHTLAVDRGRGGGGKLRSFIALESICILKLSVCFNQSVCLKLPPPTLLLWKILGLQQLLQFSKGWQSNKQHFPSLFFFHSLQRWGVTYKLDEAWAALHHAHVTVLTLSNLVFLRCKIFHLSLQHASTSWCCWITTCCFHSSTTPTIHI